MSINHDGSGSVEPKVVWTYAARAVPEDARAERLSTESQAALRQFSVNRLVGYGVDISDAAELHERVLEGEIWQSAATCLAERSVARARISGVAPPTVIDSLRRASALLRMSQVMMRSDTAQRRRIYADAGELYNEAAELAGDICRITLDTGTGALDAWLISPPRPPAASAIVIGGIEGYAMDFESTGYALAEREVETVLLDAPGQGGTRFQYRNYLRVNWKQAFTAAVDFLDARAPGRPIAIIGNSMGGSIAMAVASEDTRISACCDNGGIPVPAMVSPDVGTLFAKMIAFCGSRDANEALGIWSTVAPLQPGANTDYALLVVHGGADPIVSAEMVETMFDHAPTMDKRMLTFSDGDHCIYNHKSDRDTLIAEWVRARLTSRDPSMLAN